jgi:chromosomal replication initiator protein
MSKGPDNLDGLFRALREADLRASISVGQIICEIESRFQVSEQNILSKVRRRQVARARHLVCYLARELTDLSLPAIGRQLGRHHTTVMDSARRGAEILKRNQSVAIELSHIAGVLKRPAQREVR